VIEANSLSQQTLLQSRCREEPLLVPFGWICDERSDRGFTLPVLYHEKLACAPLFRADIEPSNRKSSKNGIARCRSYETADNAQVEAINIADHRHIWVLTTTRM
jgi:hypothetical protein